MKKLLFLIAFLALTVSAFGETNSVPVSGGIANLLGNSFKSWFTDGSLIAIWLGILGRAWQGLKTGGGILGIWHGLMYGTNTATPKQAQAESAP